MLALAILIAGAMNRYVVTEYVLTEGVRYPVNGLLRVDRLTGNSQVCVVTTSDEEYPFDGGKRPSWCPVIKSR